MAQSAPQTTADPQIMALRLPPHSIEAEQSVLGGLLLDNTAWDRIGDMLAVDDFYRDDHRRIYRHIAQPDRDGQAGRRGDGGRVGRAAEDKDKAGGLSLSRRSSRRTRRRRTTSAATPKSCASARCMRKLVAVGTEIADSAFNPMGKDVAQLLDEAESRVFEIAEAGTRGREGFHRHPASCSPR